MSTVGGEHVSEAVREMTAVLENGPTNILERPTTASELPGVFTHLLYGHAFLADKNSTGAIVDLQQQYHP
jgi:hypothetical protein